ncbi:hypothetical protein P3X46_032772 [Hevea brasiliensis]|uniref:Uncharacterized protein n=1 Tax=Hevea brasiliensis TaxID=3981 RepID=A0ABQ9KFW0_HEVBR|nr:uncharacterized protein LOC110648553 [Hevea brasiliensis]KAJ9135609.1 hypothetical protein P3X46_032772 [Hevea brasiliensis]
MSTPLDQQQQQPPPMDVTQQAYTAHTGHGSIGPVIAVLAVITILGVIAGMIGRLCSGRRVMGNGQYDFEGWVERKCSSCLDGPVDAPAARGADIPVAEPVEEQGPQEEQVQNKHKSHASTTES